MGILDAIQKKIQDNVKSFGIEANQLEQNADREEISELKEELSEMKDNNSSLKSEIASLKSLIASLKRQLETEKLSNASLQKELKDLKAKPVPTSAPTSKPKQTAPAPKSPGFGDKVTPDDIKEISQALCESLKDFGSVTTNEVAEKLREIICEIEKYADKTVEEIKNIASGCSELSEKQAEKKKEQVKSKSAKAETTLKDIISRNVGIIASGLAKINAKHDEYLSEISKMEETANAYLEKLEEEGLSAPFSDFYIAIAASDAVCDLERAVDEATDSLNDFTNGRFSFHYSDCDTDEAYDVAISKIEDAIHSAETDIELAI